MQISIASIRYARALYALAEEMHVNKEVYQNMRLLMDFFSEAKDVRYLMANPLVPPHVKKKAVQVIFDGRIADLSIRFLNLIISKNRSADVYGIVREYIELYRERKGILRAVLRSPYPFSDAEMDAFREFPGQGSGDGEQGAAIPRGRLHFAGRWSLCGQKRGRSSACFAQGNECQGLSKEMKNGRYQSL